MVTEIIEYSPAQEAIAADQQFRDGLLHAREGLAEAARGAFALRHTNGWLQLGFKSLNEYLAQPEVTVSRTEFYRLAEAYQAYVLNGHVDPAQLSQADVSKLEVPLPALNRGLVEADEAISDAISLPRKDLRRKYNELVGKPVEEDEGDDSQSIREPDGDSPIGSLHRDVMEIRRLRREMGVLRDTLRRVMDEIGAPEKKKMSNALREAIMDALAQADEILA